MVVDRYISLRGKGERESGNILIFRCEASLWTTNVCMYVIKCPFFEVKQILPIWSQGNTRDDIWMIMSNLSKDPQKNLLKDPQKNLSKYFQQILLKNLSFNVFTKKSPKIFSENLSKYFPKNLSEYFQKKSLKYF